MPFITEDRANEILSLGKNNKCSDLAVLLPRRDTGVDNNQRISNLDRILLGTLGHIDGERETARVMGVARETVSASMDGKTSAYAKVDPLLKEKVSNSVSRFRERLQTLASSKVEAALERITEEKLDSVIKATELATIASSLAKIHRDYEPQDKNIQQNLVQFQIFRPRTREEDEYDVVEVSE